MRDFERYVNQKYKTGKRPLTVYIIPTTRDKLLSGLTEGLGDIEAGNLTVTPERQQIARCRAEAAKRGLDPDKWFNNVEPVVADRVGIETTTYVRNIYKYYVTYKLSVEAQAARRAAMESLRAGAR